MTTRQAPGRQERLALYDNIAIEALEHRRLLEMHRRRRLELLLEKMETEPRHDEEARAIGRHRAYQISAAVRAAVASR